MTIPPSEIPPGLRELYEAAGPVIRYRLLRDVLGQDDSYIQTAHLGLDLARLPEIETIANAQQPDGTWHGLLCGLPGEAEVLTTERAFLRLCELGRESSGMVNACVDKVLLPTLFSENMVWEFATVSADPAYLRAARHVVRDKVLRLLCRATRETDAVVRSHLEVVLTEWEYYLNRQPGEAAQVLPPTADAWAALCWFPWTDEELPRVHGLAARLFEQAERAMAEPAAPAALFAGELFRLHDKWQYLSRPQDLLRELELAARLGIVRELDATAWMLEELEAHQDADGLFRFDVEGPVEADWYFPLEARTAGEFPVEWSFRAAQVFKLLEYDV